MLPWLMKEGDCSLMNTGFAPVLFLEFSLRGCGGDRGGDEYEVWLCSCGGGGDECSLSSTASLPNSAPIRS